MRRALVLNGDGSGSVAHGTRKEGDDEVAGPPAGMVVGSSVESGTVQVFAWSGSFSRNDTKSYGAAPPEKSSVTASVPVPLFCRVTTMGWEKPPSGVVPKSIDGVEAVNCGAGGASAPAFDAAATVPAGEATTRPAPNIALARRWPLGRRVGIASPYARPWSTAVFWVRAIRPWSQHQMSLRSPIRAPSPSTRTPAPPGPGNAVSRPHFATRRLRERSGCSRP